MAIIKWSPFLEPFEEMDKMYQDFLPTVSSNRAMANNFLPAIDMYEDKDNIIVEAQLAGIDPEKVEISIDNDVLSIKGEGEKQSEIEEKNYYRKEIRRGSFYRNIALPAHVAGDKASAIAEAGVLKISIPKTAIGKPKNIKIQTKKK